MLPLAPLPPALLASLLGLSSGPVPAQAAGAPAASTWRATLETRGGELPFGLELSPTTAGGWMAHVINEPERIPVPDVEWDGETLTLELVTFDSRIRARRVTDGDGESLLRGEWEKVRGNGDPVRVPFEAREGYAERFLPEAEAPPADVAGRWRVDFESDPLPAVGVFEQDPGSPLVRGTFLTATGDYRYLSGRMDGDRLLLSCFDGGHAFLFDAELDADGRLAGKFHSGNWWTDTWTAERDETVTLGDAFEQTRWLGTTSLAEIVLPDLDGMPRVLASPDLLGRATVIQLFGSWCPNCHDETRYLVELEERYAERGLAFVSVAFELTDDFERNAAQVKLFAERFGVTWPILLVGTANKEEATQAFPAIDRLRSYPTTIFLDAKGRVRGVHSGFAGPATGAAHTELRAEFEARIEELLSEPSAPPEKGDGVWAKLTTQPWISHAEPAGATCTFWTDEDGRRVATYVVHGSGRPVLREDIFEVRLLGDTVWLGATPWVFDRRAGVLRTAMRFGGRLSPEGSSITPVIDEQGREDRVVLERALRDDDPLIRREAIVALAHLPGVELERVPLGPVLDDDQGTVRRAAAWALGRTGSRAAASKLAKKLVHPDPAFRREVVYALAKLAEHVPEVSAILKELRDDPDQLVREAVSRHFREDGQAEVEGYFPDGTSTWRSRQR